MNDIRRTILWVIFGFSMVLLWDKWQVHNGQKATFFPTPAAVTAPADAASAAAASGTASVPTASGSRVAAPMLQHRPRVPLVARMAWLRMRRVRSMWG